MNEVNDTVRDLPHISLGAVKAKNAICRNYFRPTVRSSSARAVLRSISA
jgi:hypothetical protein